MMLQIISFSVFLFGAVIGWLVVYFVRKYKKYNPADAGGYWCNYHYRGD